MNIFMTYSHLNVIRDDEGCFDINARNIKFSRLSVLTTYHIIARITSSRMKKYWLFFFSFFLFSFLF